MPDYEQIFKALADGKRLRILNLFLSTEGDLCGCEIEGALGLPQYQVSRHLGVLRHGKLVTARREGRWVYYSLVRKPAALQGLWEALHAAFENDARMVRDARRLRDRLALREAGHCVTGAVSRGALSRLAKGKEAGRLL